jgi:hypothetical protein
MARTAPLARMTCSNLKDNGNREWLRKVVRELAVRWGSRMDRRGEEELWRKRDVGWGSLSYLGRMAARCL